MMRSIKRWNLCRPALWLWIGVVAFCAGAGAGSLAAQPSLEQTVRLAQQRTVKIYGAGGLSGLEAYQSGFLVSPEGHVATAWSYVLDVDPVVVLDDGRRFESEIVGFEPQLELAILKVDAEGLPFFEIDATAEVLPGDPVLALSNLFGIAGGNEPASVLQGYVAGETNLEARRGTFRSAYDGPVYVLDLVANNPGAAGGALVDRRGRLVGMLGKELRDSQTGVWLNYALPSRVLRSAVGDIIAGRVSAEGVASDPTLPRDQAHAPETLGLVLVPDVLEKTPAFIDTVDPGSAAQRAGLRPDDLVLLIDGARIDNQATLRQRLRAIDRRDAVPMTLQRGSQIITVVLDP